VFLLSGRRAISKGTFDNDIHLCDGMVAELKQDSKYTRCEAIETLTDVISDWESKSQGLTSQLAIEQREENMRPRVDGC